MKTDKHKFCNICGNDKNADIQITPEGKTTFTFCTTCYEKENIKGIENLNFYGVLEKLAKGRR